MSGGGGRGCSCCCNKSGGTPAVLVLVCFAALATALYFAAVILAEVFSWHGLAFSFGLASSGALRFASAVRLSTFTLLTETGAAISLILDHVVDGRRFLLFRWAWLAAHITLARRLTFAVGWVAVSTVVLAGDIAARRPVHVLSRTMGIRGLGRELAVRLAAIAAVLTRARRRAEREPVPVVLATITDLAPRRTLMGEIKYGA
jgi:hypothetical protein